MRPLPQSATVVVPGHGWGHGRGMGQYGAKGMAENGKTYRDILQHFYAGVTIGTRAAETIRVLVESSNDVVVYADTPFTAKWSNGSIIGSSTDTARFLRVRYDGSSHIIERASTWNASSWTRLGSSSYHVVFYPGSSLLQLVFNSGSVRIYRGNIIARYASSDGMRAINELDMEHYLYGVVPRESPSTWPAEQLKAQSVAARTYAARYKDASRARGNTFDICSTTQCQVYGGYGSRSSVGGSFTALERDTTRAAVNATARQVLLYNGAPILAEFSSSTGGHTAPGNVAYQKAVPDPGDAIAPHHNWTASMRVSEIEQRWPQIGRLVDIKVTKRNGYGDWGGRVLELQVVGTTGSVTMSGWGWKNAFEWPSRSNGVRSNWFTPLYWRGDVVSAPSSASVNAGGTTTIVARIKNWGTASWPVGGNVRLSVASESPFRAASWISSTRAASVARNVSVPSKTSVGPNEVAEFRVPIDASDVAPGTYSQKFTMTADGSSIMWESFTVAINVLTPWIDEAPNLLRNGSFDEPGTTRPWRGYGLKAGDGLNTLTRAGTRSFRIAGGTSKRIDQTVELSGGAARRFTLSAWNRSNGTSSTGGPIEVTARAFYSDGATSTWRLAFPRAAHGWTYDELAFATHGSKQLDRIVVSAVMGQAAGETWFDAVRLLEDPVVNGSFEDGGARWSRIGLTETDGVVADDKADGSSSFRIAGGAGTRKVLLTVAASGRPWERFTLTGWTKTAGTTAGVGRVGYAATLLNSDGSRDTYWLDAPTAPHGWTAHSTTIVPRKAFGAALLTAEIIGQTGTAWFDAVRLAKTWTRNPSFEDGIAGWSGWALGDGDGLVTSSVRDGAGAVALTGGGKQAFIQPLGVRGYAGRLFRVSGWVRTVGTSAAGGRIDITLRVHNTDGSLSWLVVPVDRAPHDWTYVERVVRAPKTFNDVAVVLTFYDQTGAATFDGVRVANV